MEFVRKSTIRVRRLRTVFQQRSQVPLFHPIPPHPPPSPPPPPSSFFISQYRNRLLTIIMRGNLDHGSFITAPRHPSTPSISLFPLMSMQTTVGAFPTRCRSQSSRTEDIPPGISTSPSTNLHLGYLLFPGGGGGGDKSRRFGEFRH